MKARLVTVLVGLAATTLGAPVYSPDGKLIKTRLTIFRHLHFSRGTFTQL